MKYLLGVGYLAWRITEELSSKVHEVIMTLHSEHIQRNDKKSGVRSY